MSTGDINNDGSIKTYGHVYEVSGNDWSDINPQIDQKLSNFVEVVFQKLNKTDTSIQDIKTRANNLEVDKGYVIFGRLMRSITLIALYALGIVTVLPAIVCIIHAIDAGPKGKSVITIADRYITLKSQERLDIENEWDIIRDDAKNLKNHTDIKANIKVRERNGSPYQYIYPLENIYPLETALYRFHLMNEHTDKMIEDYTLTLQRIRTATEKASPFDL